jgi:hypothetical protein
MTKKNSVLIVCVLVLAGVYVFFFTDWFKPQTIQIYHASRATRGLRPGAAKSDTLPVTFGFQRELKLTEIKVVPLAAMQANKDTLPIWHLISDSNSVPIKFFFYGERIRGMKPEVPGSRPEPLQTNVTYRLFVAAGSIKGQHDFQAVGK